MWSGTEDTAAVFVGLGAERGAEPARRAAAKLVEWADGRGLKELGLWVHGLSREEAGGAAEGAVMAHYQYTQYLTRPAEKSLERLVLDGTEELAGPVEEGVVLGECVNIAWPRRWRSWAGGSALRPRCWGRRRSGSWEWRLFYRCPRAPLTVRL